MGLISSLFSGQDISASYAPYDDFWYTAAPYWQSSAGVPTDPDSSMRVSAVFACVRLLSRSVAQLPLPVYRRLPDGGKERVESGPLYRLLRYAPTPWQTSFEWRELITRSLLLRGNGYAEILYAPNGEIDRLVPIHPDRVTPYQSSNGRLTYEVRPPARPGYEDTTGGQTRTLTQDEVFHLRDLSDDGICGRSVIQFARESVGLASAQETYAARFFSQGVRPPIAIKHPGRLTVEAHKRMKDSWQESYGGIAGAHKPAILEEGADIAVLSMSNNDAQWIEGRKFSVADIARWFGVPSHAVNDLEKATFSNIEQLQIFLVTYSLGPYLALWEQSITRDLILDPDTYFAEFLVDGLLRGDTISRAQAYSLFIQNGIYSENEARVRENLNPYPGLDVPTRSQNQGRADQGGGSSTTGGQSTQGARAPNRALLIVEDTAARAVRREIESVKTAAKRHAANVVAWREWADAFYARHAAYLSEVLRIELEVARTYALEHRAELMAEGLSVLERWEPEAAPELVRLATMEG